MKITIPKLALVVLVGPSGAGKSTFAKRHFLAAETVSSDACRGIVSNDENALDASADAFELLHFIVRKRLARGLLTVVDATNVKPEARRPLLVIAKEMHCLATAIVLDLPSRLCEDRNQQRTDRRNSPRVVRDHKAKLRASLRTLDREGFRYVHVLRSVEEVEAVEIERVPLWNDRRSERGPFDIIGDVHGCSAELAALLSRLGYVPDARGIHVHPEGRRAVFLGDLVDRGPDSPGVLRIVMAMVGAGTALAVPGNHDVKLLRHLTGKRVSDSHGFRETLEQLATEDAAFQARVRDFIDGLVSHFVLDGGRLVVAHAGLAEHMHGRSSGAVRSFALYGETTGEIDEYGLPVRSPWAEAYRGRATVVYGHTPTVSLDWINGTICIDTGCVFGGRLTALRYPERELVSVEAARTYYEPIRPLVSTVPHAVAREQGLLDIEDVLTKRGIDTRLVGRVAVPEDHAKPALEVMSRFAVDPRWLVYLPPTMAPAETAPSGQLLERVEEALAYYREQGVEEVVLEEKHMGSRAVIVVARDRATAGRRFGDDGRRGVVYSRTGRPFFDDAKVEETVLARASEALDASGIYASLATDFAVLDVEIMPWSTKAKALLREQYAPVGAAAGRALACAESLLRSAAIRDPSVEDLLGRTVARRGRLERYVTAYQRYCWDVTGVDGLAIAPFHLLATEGRTHFERDHVEHMRLCGKLAEVDGALFRKTRHRLVALDDDAERVARSFFDEVVDGGGEGIVVKPRAFTLAGARGVVQPALKVRGREYLRIIYGPEYTAESNLERLRGRNVGRKRSLAIRELALGVEGLTRFVEREPLHRVHECVFGVLALESEPVDPRL